MLNYKQSSHNQGEKKNLPYFSILQFFQDIIISISHQRTKEKTTCKKGVISPPA